MPLKNREAYNAYQRTYQRKRRTEQREQYRAYRRRYIRRRNGTLNATGEQQTGTCPLCEKADQLLRFDHSHETGRFRGWLCNDCNTKLGVYEKWVVPNEAKIKHYLQRTALDVAPSLTNHQLDLD